MIQRDELFIFKKELDKLSVEYSNCRDINIKRKIYKDIQFLREIISPSDL